MNPITSLNNPRIKDVQRLKGSRGRQQQQRIVIYGLREISRAIAFDLPLDELFINEAENGNAEVQQLVEQVSQSKSRIFAVPPSVYQKIAYGNRDDGVVATAARPDLRLERLELPPNALVVVLESIEKPGNLGAVVRTADAVGADAVLVADPETDPFHPNAIRASVSCVFGGNLAMESSNRIIEWLGQHDFQVCAAAVDGDVRYDLADFSGNTAIVLGNEASGLSDHWSFLESSRLRRMNRIYLPMSGVADSLNVSTTAAILCYEARRQRGFN